MREGPAVAMRCAREMVLLEAAPESARDAVPVLYTRVNVPLFVGDGEIDYACRACDALVCEGIAPGDLAGVVVRCSCGTIGRVPRRS
jgi:hypothetical protein